MRSTAAVLAMTLIGLSPAAAQAPVGVVVYMLNPEVAFDDPADIESLKDMLGAAGAVVGLALDFLDDADVEPLIGRGAPVFLLGFAVQDGAYVVSLNAMRQVDFDLGPDASVRPAYTFLYNEFGALSGDPAGDRARIGKAAVDALTAMVGFGPPELEAPVPRQ